MENFLTDKFEEAAIISGDIMATEPGYCNFVNTARAIQLIHSHMSDALPIAVHTDVDMDGIMSAYEIFKMLSWQGVIRKTGFIINKEKEHGIKARHAEYFSEHKIGLLIVLDSSSNELEHIKNMDCDVIVIDHHDILHDELRGKTRGGEYIIVSNMVDNTETSEINSLISRSGVILEKYTCEKRMSCGLVLYELLRVYQLAYSTKDLIGEGLLYQCAGITLFTDMIPLCTARNQYYIEKTVHSNNTEPCLKQMAQQISRYQTGLDKSFINFYLAPKINKAIRAGASQEALDIVMNRPGDIKQLDRYKELQEEATANIMQGVISGTDKDDKYTMKDITDTNIAKSYCGVIAAKLCDQTKKNTVVCSLNRYTNMYEGSFRGRHTGPDYRGFFEDTYPDMYAQGHSAAFGFRATSDQLVYLMNNLWQIEPKDEAELKHYLTAGDMLDIYKGIHHIDDMQLFKRQRGLLRLAMANSKLSSEESINIRILNPGYMQGDWKGKIGYYDILGLKCMAFEEPTTEWLNIYVEYTSDIKIYVRNVRV